MLGKAATKSVVTLFHVAVVLGEMDKVAVVAKSVLAVSVANGRAVVVSSGAYVTSAVQDITSIHSVAGQSVVHATAVISLVKNGVMSCERRSRFLIPSIFHLVAADRRKVKARFIS